MRLRTLCFWLDDCWKLVSIYSHIERTNVTRPLYMWSHLRGLPFPFQSELIRISNQINQHAWHHSTSNHTHYYRLFFYQSCPTHTPRRPPLPMPHSINPATPFSSFRCAGIEGSMQKKQITQWQRKVCSIFISFQRRTLRLLLACVFRGSVVM